MASVAYSVSVAAFGLCALSGCEREASSSKSREPPVRYGEPVGIRVNGAGIAPLLAAVAVSENRNADSLANALASLLSTAVASCPAAQAKLKANKPLILRLQTRSDVLSAAMRDPDSAVTCVLDALAGGSLPGAEDLRLMVELRANSSAE